RVSGAGTAQEGQDADHRAVSAAAEREHGRRRRGEDDSLNGGITNGKCRMPNAECAKAPVSARKSPDTDYNGRRARAMQMKLMAASVFAVTLAGSLGAVQSLPDLTGADAPANGVWLDTLDYSGADVGRSLPPGKTTRNMPIKIGGATYQHGSAVT